MRARAIDLISGRHHDRMITPIISQRALHFHLPTHDDKPFVMNIALRDYSAPFFIMQKQLAKVAFAEMSYA